MQRLVPLLNFLQQLNEHLRIIALFLVFTVTAQLSYGQDENSDFESEANRIPATDVVFEPVDLKAITDREKRQLCESVLVDSTSLKLVSHEGDTIFMLSDTILSAYSFTCAASLPYPILLRNLEIKENLQLQLKQLPKLYLDQLTVNKELVIIVDFAEDVLARDLQVEKRCIVRGKKLSTLAFLRCHFNYGIELAPSNLVNLEFVGCRISSILSLANTKTAFFTVDQCTLENGFNISANVHFQFIVLNSKLSGRGYFDSPPDTTGTIYIEGNQFASNASLHFDGGVYKELEFQNDYLPDLVVFDNTKFLSPANVQAYRKPIKPAKVWFNKVDPKQYVINFQLTELLTIEPDNSAHTHHDRVNQTFQQFLDLNRKSGHKNNLYWLDLQYQKFYHLQYQPSTTNKIAYYIKDRWWKFGHKKQRILINIGFFMLLFSLINFFFLKRLSTDVYEIKGITEQTKVVGNADGKVRLGLINRFWLSVYYTGIIFFGLKMEIGSLHFNRYYLVGYIFLIYTTGLVCMAFLANWVLSF